VPLHIHHQYMQRQTTAGVAIDHLECAVRGARGMGKGARGWGRVQEGGEGCKRVGRDGLEEMVGK
jgi:hypothetical protein